MKKLFAALCAASFTVLVGCSSTPKCGDSETKDLVLQIVDEQARKMWGSVVDGISFSLSGIRTTNHNENVDSYECAAVLDMTGPGGNETADITYTVHSTDKGDQFYVEVFGL